MTDKKKPKELDWRDKIDWVDDWLEIDCQVIFGEKGKKTLIKFIEYLLTQQRTELEQQKVKVVWNDVCEQIKKDTIEQILNLECLVDEIPTMSEPEIEVDNKEIRNQLRKEIKEEITKDLFKDFKQVSNPLDKDYE